IRSISLYSFCIHAPATTEIYTLSLHDALPILQRYMDELYGLVESGRVELADILTHKMPLDQASHAYDIFKKKEDDCVKVILKPRSEEHTSELQSRENLVCRLLLEKKKEKKKKR